MPLHEERAYDCLFKVILVGDSGVGKSALLARFVDNCHESEFVATIGVDFRVRTYNFDGVKVRAQAMPAQPISPIRVDPRR